VTVIGSTNAINTNLGNNNLFPRLGGQDMGKNAVAAHIAHLNPAVQQQLEKPIAVLLGEPNAFATGQALKEIDQITGNSALSDMLSRAGGSLNNLANAAPMKAPQINYKEGKAHGVRTVNPKTKEEALPFIKELIAHSKTHWNAADQQNLNNMVASYNNLPGGKTNVAINYEGKGAKRVPVSVSVVDSPQVIEARKAAKQKAVAAAQASKMDKAFDASIANFRAKFSPDALRGNLGNAATVGLYPHLQSSNSDAAKAIGNMLLKGVEVQAAFSYGVLKGFAGGAWDMVSGLAIMAGKTLQYGADMSFFGLAGAAGDLARSSIPQSVKDFADSIGIGQVFDAVTPSLQRGIDSTKALNKMSSNVVDYFATRTPGDVGADILKAIEGKWDSLKDEFAALGDDPVKQAEWLGEIAGRVLFEAGSTLVPVTKLGLVGKLADGASDLVRLGGKITDLSKLAEVTRGAIIVAREAILGTQLGAAARDKIQDTLNALRKVETGGLPAAEQRALREAKASLEDALEISAPRDGTIGNPAAIASGFGELSTRQARVLEQLPQDGKIITIARNAVSPSDIAALTAKTGDEFAIFTNGSRRMVLRGDEGRIKISAKLLEQLKSEGWRWTAHTQPGMTIGHSIASAGDQEVLRALGQSQSMILNSKGDINIFTQTDISERMPSR
jgi:hypothetical protein